jgi:hypothetical protein
MKVMQKEKPEIAAIWANQAEARVFFQTRPSTPGSAAGGELIGGLLLQSAATSLLDHADHRGHGDGDRPGLTSR